MNADLVKAQCHIVNLSSLGVVSGLTLVLCGGAAAFLITMVNVIISMLLACIIMRNVEINLKREIIGYLHLDKVLRMGSSLIYTCR